EQRYGSLVEHVPLGIFTTNGMIWTFANQFERALIGLPEGDEPSFAHWTAALHPEDRERVVRNFRTAVERQLPFECDFRFKRADGSVKHVLSRGVPVLNSPTE